MSTARVLIVDDDPAIRHAVAMMLEDEGYAVITAANGVEALDRIKESAPGLVLLDLQMPEMDGWQVQGRLRQIMPELPVVFMTAGYRARAEAERHAAAGYIAKPFDMDHLLDVVGRFVAVPPS